MNTIASNLDAIYKYQIMATLAIRGHGTRFKEVIEILEMLGGKRIKITKLLLMCITSVNMLAGENYIYKFSAKK